MPAKVDYGNTWYLLIPEREERRSFFLDLRDSIVYPCGTLTLPPQVGKCIFCKKEPDKHRVLIVPGVCSDLTCVKKMYKQAASNGTRRITRLLKGTKIPPFRLTAG